MWNPFSSFFIPPFCLVLLQHWKVLENQAQITSFWKWFNLIGFLVLCFRILWDLKSLALTLVEYVTMQVVSTVNTKAGREQPYNTRWGLNIYIYLGTKIQVLTTSSPEPHYLTINRQTSFGEHFQLLRIALWFELRSDYCSPFSLHEA